MSDRFDDAADRTFALDAEQYMRRLADNIRAETARERSAGRNPDDSAMHWAALVSGAAGALRGTGQLTSSRARELELMALQPFIDSGRLAPVDVKSEASTSLEPPHREGEA